MKRLFFLIIFIYSNIQAQNVSWLKTKSDGKGNSTTYSVANHSQGIYGTGVYDKSITIGSTTIESSSFVDFGEIWIAKFDYNGRPSWVKAVGGGGYDWPNSLTSDIYDNCYVVGQLEPSRLPINFDNISPIIEDGTIKAGFLAKYDTDGNAMWVKTLSGMGSESVLLGVATYLDLVYVVGNFTDTVIFDSFELTSKGGSDIFVAELRSNGKVNWVKTYGGAEDDFAQSVYANNLGVFLGGGFSSIISFDSNNLLSKGGTDAFIAKMDEISQQVQWAIQLGGNMDDKAISIKVADDIINVSGHYNNYLTCKDTEGNTSILFSQGKNDIFLGQFSMKGTTNWIKSFGGEGNDYMWGLSYNDKNRIYFTGNFGGAIDFDDISLSAISTFENGYIGSCDFNGDIIWLKHIKSRNMVTGNCVSVNEKYEYIPNVYFGGFYNFEMEISNNSLKSDQYSLFIGKINQIMADTPNKKSGQKNGEAVFPNPSSGTIYLSNLEDVSELYITNQQGQVLIKKNITKNIKNLEFDLKALGFQPGIFYVITENDLYKDVFKFILKE